jgi:TusA-related sulfurtransferase
MSCPHTAKRSVGAPDVETKDRIVPEEPTYEWNAEDAGCGDLVMGLHRWVRTLSRAARVRVRAKPPEAGADIPAWCRLRGYRCTSLHFDSQAEVWPIVFWLLPAD